MGLRWYVARTEPRAEFLAAQELSRDGYEIFSPCIKAPRPRPGLTNVPLFPGYLFLRCDPESEGWPVFRGAHRITGWVKFGGEIPCLPDDVMAEMMDRWEMINRQGGMLRRFLPGEKVLVDSGSFQGLAEVVEEAKSPQARAKVLLHFMGRLVQAQVPWENLKPVEDEPWETNQPPRRTRGRGRWIRGFGPRAMAGA